MNNATLSIASDYVRAGMRKAGVPLTETLEAYLSITFAKFISAAIKVDQLTVRAARAMEANAPTDAMRALADECLIACAFFEERLRRSGSVRHYVGLGQASYDAADLTEQAYGFVHMRDVIASAVDRREPRDGHILLDQVRAGSRTAITELEEQNVVVGPWVGRQKPGLLWR